ncbi:MAG: MOSC domain-containing protein, partial [Variovorax sp.]
MTKIGTVSSIVRYPVKSMAGEIIKSAFVGFAGLFGDRIYAFVQPQRRAGFPWFTIRELEDLVRYKARFVAPAAAEAPVEMQTSLALGVGVTSLYPTENALDVEVEAPTGIRYAIRAPELKVHLETETDRKIELRYSERSQCDCRPISIFANATVSALGGEIGMPLDPRRFRASFYVDWDCGEPYFENSLVGRIIRIGERCRVMLTERDPRCKIVTIDPDTGDESPKILRHISSAHQGTAGVYGAVLLEGVVRAGDPI